MFCRIDGSSMLKALIRTGSVTAFSRADGYIVIPRQQEYLEAGATVDVCLLGKEIRPADLVARTRAEIDSLRGDMREAVEHGISMQRALAALPPADATRPVSLNSRRRRNAVRIYLEEERSYMGLDSTL